ncbi:MAG: GNAT family N-acetyltransferase [Ferruginibacter sp.]
MIRYLKHDAIDKSKWDNCIAGAVNSLLYGYSFYLDAIADNWDAVVVNDYEAVMPLTWRKKYFTAYLYQPPFTQQLGVFYKTPISKDIFSEIENVINAHFKFAEIFINHANTGIFESSRSIPQVNYVLDINRPYDIIHSGFLPGFTKSLRRIAKFNFAYNSSADIDTVISLYRNLYGNRVQHLRESDFAAFKKCCARLQQQDQLVIRHAATANGNLLAAVLLFKDEKRLYNIISCVTEEGKKMEVNYFLYDSIIREFCNSGRLLDLEGSDIKGVADFYIKMNPVNQPYSFYRYNHLPALMKLFKK